MGSKLSQNALSYAVRLHVVGHYIGELGLVLAAVSLVPLLFAVCAGDAGFAARTALCVGLTGGAAFGLSRLPAPERIQHNEALVICGSMFLIAPLVMVYPLVGEGLSFVDALFETVSGVTTTGLSTVASLETRSASFIFSRAWMQWYGGLGILALSLALLTRPGMAARRLSDTEADEDETVGGTRAHSRRILMAYLGLTVAGILLLLAFGAPLMSALTHAMAGISTGGFSPYENSLAGMPGWGIRGAVLLVSTAGAVSFVLYYRFLGGTWRRDIRNVELRALIVLCLLVSAGLALTMHFSMPLPWGEVIGHALSMGFSAQTTTGFATMDIGELHPVARFVLTVSMFVGGNLGSTAGGIKVVRLLIMLQLLRAMIRGTSLTEHAVEAPRLGGRPVEPAAARDALLVIFLFLGIVSLSWMAFLAAGHDPMNSLFDVVSATGTVGLSTGVVGPELEPALKGVLCFDMLAGRLEMLALLTLMYPGTWIGRRRN